MSGPKSFRAACLAACGLSFWLAAVLVCGAAEPASVTRADSERAPWHIRSIAKRSQARPDAGPVTAEGRSARFLHIRLALRPGSSDAKLYQFRVVDERGSTVAEVYGFYRDRSVVVFEGDWTRLEGLYLDGMGHREPLFAAAPAVRSKQAKMSDLGAPPAPSSQAVLVPRKGPKGPAKLYQEVLVTHKSRYQIQGLGFDTNLQYRVLSSLEVGPTDADGSLGVTQRVEEAKLTQGDAMVEAVFAGLLQKLVGSTFRIKLSPRRKVVRFEGAREIVRAAGGNPLAGDSLMLASVIDPDGWKELAELSFFRPPAPLREGEIWDRPTTHSWGPLGAWSGSAWYSYKGREDGLDCISYKFRLTHQAPKPGAGGLPLQVLAADFAHQEAGGTVYYNRSKRRVVRAEEHFPVKGTLKVSLLGQETPIALEEQQTFTLRILDHPPGPE